MKPLLASLMLVLGSAACSTGGAPPSVPERTGERPEEPSAEVVALVCRTEHTDASSKVFVAVDSTGRAARLKVTPSRRIADMGNLVFDREGVLLGHDTGGEFPWDDKDAMAKERERVEGLMGGARVPEGATPIECD